MQDPQRGSTVHSLQELKKRLDNAQDLVVDEQGRIHLPDDPEVQQKRPNEKTFIKPSRWFN